MIDVTDCEVQWDRAAVLQKLVDSSTRQIWVGEQLYDGTVGGAVRFFKSLPRDQQDGIEMFVDAGVVAGLEEDTIIGTEVLRALASRSDVPRE